MPCFAIGYAGSTSAGPDLGRDGGPGRNLAEFPGLGRTRTMCVHAPIWTRRDPRCRPAGRFRLRVGATRTDSTRPQNRIGPRSRRPRLAGAGMRCYLIPSLVDTDPFHGGGLALPVRRGLRRGAGRDAGPRVPDGGQAAQRAPIRRATDGGEMGPYQRDLV